MGSLAGGGAPPEIEVGNLKICPLTSGDNFNERRRQVVSRSTRFRWWSAGGTAISGGGTPDTGDGTQFRPLLAEFYHCVQAYG